MIIAGMNKYFTKHGRIIGLVIVIIISVTFVLFFGGMSIFDNIGRGNSNVITLLGRKIYLEDRQEEVKRIFLWYSLHNPSIYPGKANMPLDSGTIVNNLLQTFAAEDMGIVVGDKAVDDYIRSVPMFQTAGKYDSKKYETYVKDKLKPAYYQQKDLKEAVREMLQHEALTKTIIESVIVPEKEIKEAYTDLYTKVDAKLLVYKAKDYSKNIVLKEDELKGYYNSKKDQYKTPPAAKGKLVLFSYNDSSKEAAEQVSEKDMLKYYNDNKYLYIKKKDPAKEKPKKDSKPAKPEYKPFKEVKDQIRKELADKKKKTITAEKAQKFADNTALLVTDVFYEINDKAKAELKALEIFSKEAEKQKHKVVDSGWLYKGTDDVKEFGKEGKVVETMNSLFDDNPVSEPVKGKDGVFVAILESKKGPKPQSFEEVKDRVRKELQTNKALLLAEEGARTAAVEISKKLDKGEKIEDIEKAMKIKFKKLDTISAFMPPFIPNGGIIQKLAFDTHKGKLSKVETTKNGALLVYVVDKKFPTDEEFNKQKGYFAMQYKRSKQQSAYRNYISSLVKASELETKK